MKPLLCIFGFHNFSDRKETSRQVVELPSIIPFTEKYINRTTFIYYEKQCAECRKKEQTFTAQNILTHK